MKNVVLIRKDEEEIVKENNKSRKHKRVASDTNLEENIKGKSTIKRNSCRYVKLTIKFSKEELQDN
jgi:hypothetical protein